METLQFTEANKPSRSYGPALIYVSILSAISVFWIGVESLFQVWQTPEYSHGPLIPVLSAFMFLRDMKFVPTVRAGEHVKDRWPGCLVVVIAISIGILGNLVRIPDIVTYGLILWIWGMILVAFGYQRGKGLWVGVLHLVFMLPLPNFLYWHFSIFLQQISSEIGVWIIRLFDIAVLLDGNIIDLGDLKLQVAEACSGLRYLFPIMSFSYVFSVLYTGPRWHKAVLLVSAAPITILMNSVRIGIIGVLVENYGIGHAEGFLHAFEGWVIFVACIGILFLMAIALQRLTPDPTPIGDAIDLDFSGIKAQLSRFHNLSANQATVFVALFTVGVALSLQLSPSRETIAVNREPLATFPHYIGSWKIRTHNRLAPEIEKILGANDYLSTTYLQGSGNRSHHKINLFIAWYEKQTEGSGIHSPEICIPAGGWEVSKWSQRTVITTGQSSDNIKLNQAVIEKGSRKQLVYYWFEQRGRRITSDYTVKALSLWDSIAYGRSDGGLVRLITPLGHREPIENAQKRLDTFILGLVPVIGRYIPGR